MNWAVSGAVPFSLAESRQKPQSAGETRICGTQAFCTAGPVLAKWPEQAIGWGWQLRVIDSERRVDQRGGFFRGSFRRGLSAGLRGR